jgi:phage-related protein
LPVDKKRKLYFFKDHFNNFYSSQTTKVKNKILWTLRVIEDLDRIPEIYFKHLEGTDGLYEIRVQSGSDIFRILCFFDDNNLVVIGHGFQKKTQKTPEREIEKGEKIKREYYEEKKLNKSK